MPGTNYKGRLYYERVACNRWEMKFLVVQDIPLLLQVIKTAIIIIKLSIPFQSIATNYDIEFKFAFLDPVN